jgi:hypothetical protein
MAYSLFFGNQDSILEGEKDVQESSIFGARRVSA